MDITGYSTDFIVDSTFPVGLKRFVLRQQERWPGLYLYGEPSDVRLLVAQTPRLTVDADLLSKKLVGPGTSVDVVLVDGMVGFYIGGSPHLMLFLDDQGHAVEESVRLARNVLVWEEEGVAIRLEGAFTRERALELAESLR